MSAETKTRYYLGAKWAHEGDDPREFGQIGFDHEIGADPETEVREQIAAMARGPEAPFDRPLKWVKVFSIHDRQAPYSLEMFGEPEMFEGLPLLNNVLGEAVLR